MHDDLVRPDAVFVHEALGDRSHYYVDIEGHDKPVAVAEQNIEEDVDYAADTNAQVWLSWRSASVVLLPPA